MITRRNVVAGAAALVAVPQIARAQAAPVQFRISTAGAEQDWLARSLYQFKEAVEKDLPGQIAVSVHPNSSLFRQGTELPAIQRGNLEMSTMTTFEIEQQLPEYGLFSAGYMFRDYDHMRKVMDGPIGKEYIAAVGSKMGIEIIDFIYLGTRQVNLRQAKDVKTPADLAGVKLRMPPGAGWTALGRGLGVTPTPMAMPEVYLALQTGSIDGQENPLTIMNAAKMHEVTKQVVLTAHMVQPVFYTMRKSLWDTLTDAQKKAVKDAAVVATKWNSESRLADEQKVVERIKAAGLRVDTIDLKPFRENADKIYGASEHAKAWDKALLQQTVDTK